MNEKYSISYWDHNDKAKKLVEGTLPELSAAYLTFVNSETDHRHGPATLTLDGKEAGFINARGQVYLKQPSHILVYDPTTGAKT